MNQMFYQELREKCIEISNAEFENPNKMVKVLEAYDRIIQLSRGARKEGLLGLEEMAEKLDRKIDTERFLYTLLMLVVDGADSEYVYEAGMSRCMAWNKASYDGLVMLMYLRGALLVQAGCNPKVIGTLIETMLPKCILEILEKE